MHRVLVLGAGGREHALCWRLAQELGKENVFVCPGNDGLVDSAQPLQLDVYDYSGLTKFIDEQNIQYIVVGPEEPLVRGWRDEMEKRLNDSNVSIIGPTAKASILEGSKAWARDFCVRHNIPVPFYKIFHENEYDQAIAYLQQITPPYVIKADGLAAGKGVAICQTFDEAQAYLTKTMQEKIFGSAGNKVVVEQFLEGWEVSVFIATDGESYILLPEAKDYKRVFDNNEGPNTGGMGAVSPVPLVDSTLQQKIRDRIIEPTLVGLRKEQITYQGFLFFGLMIVKDNPYLIEYNVRLGDPETQTILPRLKSSFLDLLEAIASKSLHRYSIKIASTYAATVIMASQGYPGNYQKGYPITVKQKVDNHNVHLFYAGVKRERDALVSAGGRVLAVVGVANTLQAALDIAYKQVSMIHFDAAHYRKDIGQDLLKLM